MDSVTSEMSQEFPMDDHETIDTHDGSTSYADVIDLTNYEDEEDVNDPAENQLSDRLQLQGKMRRAKSRKATRGDPKKSTKSPFYPSNRRQHSILTPYDEPTRADVDSPQGPSGYGSQYEAQSPENSLYAPPRAFASPQDERRMSYRSLAESSYGRYDPFAGGPAGFRGVSPSASMMFDDAQSTAGESVRDLLSRQSRTGSMVLLEDNSGDPTGDAALWVDQSDYAAMNALSEVARPGKPKLSTVLDEEIQQASGSMIVASESRGYESIPARKLTRVSACGPATLNTVVRNLVSRRISPGKIRHGDRTGHIAIYSEDYEA